MTTADSESEFCVVNQEIVLEQPSKELQSTANIACFRNCQNIDNSFIDNIQSGVNLNELAHTVHEMKKKIDVLAEHFAFLFTPFDKSEQD